jgi:Zn-dependent peptidase ImmA (M78 family)
MSKRTLVDICNTSWEVREVTSSYLAKLNDGEAAYGLVDFDQEIIYLDRNLSHHRKSVTLVHEFLHVIYDRSGGGFPLEDEEKIISQLEHGVYELINQFPEKYKRGSDDE